VRRGRILVAKVGLDGHTTGAAVVARGLRDAGFEVVNLGTRVEPAVAVASAIQEDVDAIGVSILSGAHMHIARRLIEEREQQGVDIPLVIGGTIPGSDAAELKSRGVTEVFGPGSSMESIVACMDRLVEARGSGAEPVAAGRS
jgi:methylmalonyl-CoA mutase, C-terminal domain